MNESAIGDVLKAMYEMAQYAASDLVGEQRDFYLPRITKSFYILGQQFPEILAQILRDEIKGELGPKR